MVGEFLSKRYLLVIDSGNTAIKWGLHDGDRWVARGITLQSERMTMTQAWIKLPVPSSIIVSNVAGLSVVKDLESLLTLWPVQPKWITTQASQCGVRNCYSNPGQLGCDRWAALIAAWYILRQGCLVINVGTAMTVDALTDTGEFVGGIIVPGLGLMKQTLASRIDALSFLASGSFQDFPNNTENALYSGVIHALAGSLERMYDRLLVYLNKQGIPAILSGGDAALLSAHIRVPHRVVNDLVLEGLVVISRESS
jgi:type III pantothenate kinase